MTNLLTVFLFFYFVLGLLTLLVLRYLHRNQPESLHEFVARMRNVNLPARKRKISDLMFQLSIRSTVLAFLILTWPIILFFRLWQTFSSTGLDKKSGE